MKSLRITKLMAILLLAGIMTACGNDLKDSNVTENAKVSVEVADLLEDTAPTEATQPSEPGTSEVPEGSADKISSEDNEKTPSESDKADKTNKTDKTDKPSAGSSNKNNDGTKKPTADEGKSETPSNPAPSEPNPNSASSDDKTNQDKPSSGGSDKKSEAAEEEDDTSEDEKPASGTTTGRPGITNTSGESESSKTNIGSTKVSYCKHCGKVNGNGAGGTCVRWLLAGNHTCSNCGASVPGKTCHTCG